MDTGPKSLGDELEAFVRDQASRFGEVISYVPAKRIAPITSTTTAAATSETSMSAPSQNLGSGSIRLEELNELLAVHKGESWTSTTTLAELEHSIADCQKCALGATRNKLVFGVGSPHAKVMVIGEAPGADEDEKGEPFVGKAGQLLTKMLAAINFSREEIFIANILKSRPPNNRDPKPEEVAACEPYLWKQIALIQPKFILCFGRVAGLNLLKLKPEPLAKMRGNMYDFHGVQVMVTYHPAALLRNPDWKTGAWEDLQQFRRLYDASL